MFEQDYDPDPTFWDGATPKWYQGWGGKWYADYIYADISTTPLESTRALKFYRDFYMGIGLRHCATYANPIEDAVRSGHYHMRELDKRGK